MYNRSKAQQSKNRVHISWDKLYTAAHTDYLVLSRLGRNTKRISAEQTISLQGDYRTLGISGQIFYSDSVTQTDQINQSGFSNCFIYDYINSLYLGQTLRQSKTVIENLYSSQLVPGKNRTQNDS